VICACGNTWTTGSTRKMIRTDVCSACHPFFTGEQRIVDTAGQVDRFMRRLQQAEERAAQVQVQQKAEEAARKAAAQARARGESPKKAKQIAERAAEDVIAASSPGKRAVETVAEMPVETVEAVVEAAGELVDDIQETIAD
jgi:large subunit ribosomal protein L31